jgi:glutaredoxin 3
MRVVLFTRPSCKYCVKAKELLLTKKNAEVYQIILDDQQSYDQARAEMVRLADGKTSVPQIFINGVFIPGGATGLQELDASGKLDELLSEDSDENTLFPEKLDGMDWNLERLQVNLKVEDMDF